MARAGELLASSDIPVTEVAHRVGYREASQLTKAFRRTYAATPSEFRARRGGSSYGD